MRALPHCVIAALAAAAPAAFRSPSPEGLRSTVLCLHQAFVERLHISRRYERWFGGVVYLMLPGTAGRKRGHEATGETATVASRETCAKYNVACFFARHAEGSPHMAAYSQLFGQLAQFARHDMPPPWLRPYWHGEHGVTGAVVAHLDFWLDPPSFEHRIRTMELDLRRPWMLAAGLNRPHSDGVAEYRVFGRSCLAGQALETDTEWNWGHDAKGVVRAWAAAAPSTAPEACAAWADFFYVPSQVFADFALRCGKHFKNTQHEVSVPTVLRLLEVEGEAPTPQYIDCWGCLGRRATRGAF